MDLADLMQGAVEFQWDQGNIEKNWRTHQVSQSECEDVFFNQSLMTSDAGYSKNEQRYFAFGETTRNRKLCMVFTLRSGKIRIISARDMSRKERRSYHEKIKKNPPVQE